MTGLVYNPQITTDCAGGAIITWRDYRSGSQYDIYAQRVSNPAPTVTDITPDFGINNGTVNITDLEGTGFSDIGGAPVVKLKKTDETDIDGTSIVVVSSTQITCDFNLNVVAVGDWDVCVENFDGQSGTLADGFRVNYPNPPNPTSITPDYGINDGTVIVTDLKGTGFENGAVVKLKLVEARPSS